ncbi:MAG TPA: pitrilysin family protein [Longimicrobiaceae bacterium]
MRIHSVRPALALAAVASIAVVSVPARAQQAPPTPGTPRPFSVPAAREFSLSNGMKVTLVPYGEVPKAQVQLIVRVGNVDEGADEVWLADVTGDLMQEGTTNRSAEQIARDAASMGGSIGIGVSSALTNISGDALSEFVPQMVELIADIAQNPSFPAEALERIRADRLRQLSIQLSQPQAQALRKFVSVLYPSHPYGRPFPTPEMLQGFTAEQVRAFYQENFSAARAHLYVAGRFDEVATEQAIRAAFEGWEAGSESMPSIPSPESGRAVYLVDSPGAVQSTIYLGLPVIDPSNPDYIPLQVTNALLGGSFASRITSNIREQKGYTYSPFSTLSSRYRDAYWAEIADVTTDVTGPALTEIFFEIDRLRGEPPSEEELRGIQNYLAGTFVLQNSSRGGIISQLSFINLHGLGRDWLESYVPRVYEVTPAEVMHIARTYLDPSRMTIVVVGDRSKIEDQLREFGEIRE